MKDERYNIIKRKIDLKNLNLFSSIFEMPSIEINQQHKITKFNDAAKKLFYPLQKRLSNIHLKTLFTKLQINFSDFSQHISKSPQTVYQRERIKILSIKKSGRNPGYIIFFQQSVDTDQAKLITAASVNKKNNAQINHESLLKIYSEITGQEVKSIKNPEEYVKEIRSYLENIIALMPGNVYWKNSSGDFLGCNNNTLKYFKLKSRKQLIGKNDFDLQQDKRLAKRIWETDQEIMKKTRQQA